MYRAVLSQAAPRYGALLGARSFAVTGRHSKKVASTKNKADAMRCKLYVRLGVKILMAAKAGGPDPSNNPDLARVLKEASSVKLPKENIERALSKASDQSTEAFTSGLYEVLGFGGAGFIVASLTDNPNRAVKEIKAFAKKADAKIPSQGSVLFNFDHRAVFFPQQVYDKDAVLEQALSLDISDVQFAPNTLMEAEDGAPLPDMIVTSADELTLLQDLAAQLQMAGTSSRVYLPTELVKVSAEDMQRNYELIEGFEALDDVDAVYHNMAMQ